MPRCGSQIFLCDVPVRLDTYSGCTHDCRYCFSRAKIDISKVKTDEGEDSLKRWLDGKGDGETSWCDWPLPIHIGGMSDPLQPAEEERKATLPCLKLLAKRGAPYILSTKSILGTKNPWFSALSNGRVVFQMSMTAPSYDRMECGAPPFERRLQALKELSPELTRVIVRCQPYMPNVLVEVLEALPRYKDAGVYGVTFEGMKSKTTAGGMVKLGGDCCYPQSILEDHFLKLREKCHSLGLAFFAAENRLRRLSDDRCCCGTVGLEGFQPNRANLNSLVFGEKIEYTPRMQEVGTATAFKTIVQGVTGRHLKKVSYAQCMQWLAESARSRAVLGMR